MNEHNGHSWTDRAAQALFPLALGLAVAALILAIADGATGAIALYSVWLASLAILVTLRSWALRFFRRLSGDAGQPGRELLSIELPPSTRRWSIGAIGLTIFAISYAIGLFSDLLLENEPFQRRHVGQLAIVMGILAIPFGRPNPFRPLRGHRIVLTENGVLLQIDPGVVEVFHPWENLVDYYWRIRGNDAILFFHARRYPGGPTWPIPQLGSIECGPIDEATRQQIDTHLREKLPPGTPQPASTI